MFDNINPAQWLWYYYNFLEDNKESFEHNRDMVEYHASFIEPEAVRKIRESRDESVMVPDEEFTAGIEHFFGRKINLPSEKRKGMQSHSIDPEVAARMSKTYQTRKETEEFKKSRTIDAKHWLNLDLE